MRQKTSPTEKTTNTKTRKTPTIASSTHQPKIALQRSPSTQSLSRLHAPLSSDLRVVVELSVTVDVVVVTGVDDDDDDNDDDDVLGVVAVAVDDDDTVDEVVVELGFDVNVVIVADNDDDDDNVDDDNNVDDVVVLCNVVVVVLCVNGRVSINSALTMLNTKHSVNSILYNIMLTMNPAIVIT